MALKKNIRQENERGTLIVIYAGMILGLMGFAGLAIDVGYLQYEQRRIQAAADAAAMGALREMERGNTDLTSAGRYDASLNGFTNDKNDVTVTISNPPDSGAYEDDKTAVQAIVKKKVPTFFMRIFGQNSTGLTAAATAQTSTNYGSVGGCIFVLDGTADKAFTVAGTGNMTSACGAVVDSTASDAFYMTGTSNFVLNQGANVGVVGPGTGQGWLFSGGGTLVNGTTGKSESPVNIQTFSDPLASITAPTGGNVVATNEHINPQASATLYPGVYCNGMFLQGTVDFKSGTYILAGGGLQVDSTATLTNSDGNGVMFYNTSGSYNSACGTISAGAIKFNGGSTTTLTGLNVTDGSGTCGVLFFEDRSITGLSHTINGTSTSTFDGALYFPHANLTFTGTNKTPGFLYIVSDTLTLNGTANLSNDHSELANVNTLAPTSTGGGLVY